MPKPEPQTILLVEDSPTAAHFYEKCLREEGYQVASTAHGQQAIAFLGWAKPAAIVLDLLLPDTNGMEVLKHARAAHPDLPVIVVTANNSVDVAVEAMKRGAFDFIVKPFSAARLATTVRNALERKALIEEMTELRQVAAPSRFQDFIGPSAAMQAVYRVIDTVASSKASVFIRGESGTGKELAAQAIHRASPRREKPFIALNCASIPHDRLESELFGHGGNTHPGAAQMAQNGTLFLDDVCEMPLELQVKLLRLLQTGEIMPVGGARTEIVDVRVVAATECDPLEQMHAGGLREDLFYRLNVVPLEMPALREREDDVLHLAQHFLGMYNAEEGKNFTGFDPEVMSLFRRYDWPGNVRQLENVVRNVAVLNAGDIVTPAMMPSDLQRLAEQSLWPANQNAQEIMLAEFSTGDAIKPLWLAEKDAIMKALDFTRHDMAQAAALLQISPATLYRKVHAWKAGAAA